VTWRICLEMQDTPGAVKRKRAMVVSRTAEGEYVAVPAAPRPGDQHEELEPEPVPVRIELEPEPVGAPTTVVTPDPGIRRVSR
jgi:hypothetical protein